MLAPLICLLGSSWVVSSAVLDPALYLSPSPPLVPNSDDVSAEQRWMQTFETRVERDAADLTVVPLEKKLETRRQPDPPETMAEAETFWPSLRPGSYGIRSLHVPLTFAVSGSYGRYADAGSAGVIGSTYVSSQGDHSGLYGNYGKSAFAGSGYSYGSGLGTRVYGNNGGVSWSGWGNGKWGHYGKG